MPRRYTGPEILKVLQEFGWVVERQRSSHVILLRPGLPGQVTVPVYGSEQIIQKTFSSILRQAGLRRPDFDRMAREVL